MQLVKSGSGGINDNPDGGNPDVQDHSTQEGDKHSTDLNVDGAKEIRVISQSISPSFNKMNRDEVHGPSLYENVMVMGTVNINDPSSNKNHIYHNSSKGSNTNIPKTNDNLHAPDNSIIQTKVSFSPTKDTSTSFKMVII